MKFNSNYCFPYKDNFNLYNLIKKINRHYALFINKINNSFIIVDTAKNCQICYKFDNFKRDLIKILEYTKIENANDIFNDIENNNKKVEELRKKQALDFSKNLIYEMNKYTNRTTKNISMVHLNKIIEENKC